MELQTRLVFIDTSAYEHKKLQFGHFALLRLQDLVESKKIHLLITDVVREEIENHLKKFADEAVTAHKQFRRNASFLQVADTATGGQLFPEITSEAVLSEAIKKFHRLVNNGFTETVSIETVNPRKIFDDYFSGAAPFHRAAKKSEFPDAFSLAAVDAVARARHHSIYIVSNDGDMKAVADNNERFIYLESIDALLDLVNRNDAELAELSSFADSVLQLLRENILEIAKNKIEEAEFTASTYEGIDPEVEEVEVKNVEIIGLQLIDVSRDGATYEAEYQAVLNVTYGLADYSHANYDREDRVYYGIEYSTHVFSHSENFTGIIDIGFVDGLRENAEIIDMDFDDALFNLDFDNGLHIQELFTNGKD